MGDQLTFQNTTRIPGKPSYHRIWAAFLILAMVASVFLAGQMPASADGDVSSPVTGAATNGLIEVSDMSNGGWGLVQAPTESIDVVQFGEDGIADQVFNGLTATEYFSNGRLNKSYIRFEVNQTAKVNLTGTLEVKGDDFNETVPYSVAEGAQLSVYTIFPESTGHYELWLKADGYDEPLVWVEGHLERVRDGEFVHQFIGGRADPDALVLTADETGMNIDLGSVRAQLTSCAQFFAPMNGTFDIGVDVDGNSAIDPVELVSKEIDGQTKVCIETPESNIPLTSYYLAQVRSQNGEVVAQNNGLYDFLNKSSVNSVKEASPEFVKQFKVQWARTPVATSIEVKNSLLRAPAVHVTVVPEVEEVTQDIIQNGHDGDNTPFLLNDASPPTDGGAGSASQNSGAANNDAITGPDIGPTDSTQINEVVQPLIDNWILLVAVFGVVFATMFMVRGIVSGRSLSYQSN